MTSPEIQLLAKQLLLCHQGKTPLEGSTPTLEELIALTDDRLPFQRKQQVYAYLNASPTLMGQWLTIAEATHDRRSTTIIKKLFTIDRLTNRLIERCSNKHFSGLSTAGAIVLVLLALFPIIRNNLQPDTTNTMTSTEPGSTREILETQILLTLSSTETNCIKLMENGDRHKHLLLRLEIIKTHYLEEKLVPPSALIQLTDNPSINHTSSCQLVSQLRESIEN